MIDIRAAAANPDFYEKKLQQRDSSISIAPLIEMERARVNYTNEVQQLRERINAANVDMAQLDKKSPEFASKREELSGISRKIRDLDTLRVQVESKLTSEILCLPNIILDEVPISNVKEDSVLISSFGAKPVLGFKYRSHEDIVTSLGMIDFERGAKVAAKGFPIYRGKGALLEFALLQFMIEHHTQAGFEFVLPPIMNNTATLTRTGTLPRFADQIYSCKDDELHMVPTAEVPLTGMFANETLDLSNGSKRFFAYTPNFRREAGTYGQRDKGLLRLHQFNKVETYSFAKPSDSRRELTELVTNASNLLEKLGLHYRVSNLPSCDLAHQSAQTYDIEIWLPFQERYSEVSSGSNCTDYQSRRANIRFKDETGSHLVHTINCSGLATPRLMVALLETNQTESGNVRVPKVLQKYTGFDTI